MTSRTGNPCSRGSGSPFMATATSACRPSKAYSVGKPEFQLSTERPTICVAPRCTPARFSTASRGTPRHTALSTRFPPTRLETQLSVTGVSTRPMPMSSRKFME